MSCYTPLKGWYSKKRNPTGKRSIVFKRSDGLYDRPAVVPCGQCIGCRLDKARNWAIRCVHEASLYDSNCFVTLTFDDDHLNSKCSLNKRDFQLFMKRLRKRFGDGVRYFHCGEYGEEFSRPHHHACIFNFDFRDKVLWRIDNGFRLYTSDILNEIWGNGYCIIGDVNFESASYVARYVLKKITGEKAGDHYQGRESEFITMSRRPGIGSVWLDKYYKDVYNGDFVLMKGLKFKPPKYYDSRFELTNPDLLGKLKGIRSEYGKNNPHNTAERLYVRGRCRWLKSQKLGRRYEVGSVCSV